MEIRCRIWCSAKVISARAKRRRWKIDLTAHRECDASPLAVAVKLPSFESIVFYSPLKKKFYGVINTGNFSSDDSETQNQPWFNDVLLFFTRPQYARGIKKQAPEFDSLCNLDSATCVTKYVEIKHSGTAPVI